jgi:hypothetical protein
MKDEQLPVDNFSIHRRRVLDNPGAVATSSATIDNQTILGHSETWIVKTVRVAGRDTAFIQHIDADGSQRLVLPPEVTAVLARQRDALGTLTRRKAARAVAADRKARGIEPAFLRSKRLEGEAAK